MFSWIVTAVLCLLAQNGSCIKIGAIFRKDVDWHLVEAFRQATEWSQANVFDAQNLNAHKWKSANLDLIYKIEFISSTSSEYEVAKRACALAGWGAVALFGPSDFKLSRMIGNYVDSLQLLYFDISWDSKTNADRFNIFPPTHKFLQAYEDLILYWRWERVIVIYESDESFLQVQNLLQSRKLSHSQLAMVKIDDDNHVDVMQRVLSSEMTTVVVHLPTHRVQKLLMAALQVGAINFRYSYLLTSLDLLSLDLEYFRHNHVRITGFTMSSNKTAGQQDIIESIKRMWTKKGADSTYFPRTEIAFLVDAVVSFAHGYLNSSVLFADGDDDNVRAQCNMVRGILIPYPLGSTLFNYIGHAIDQVDGLTGRISFSNGYRTELAMDIFQLGYDGDIDVIGAWHSDGNLVRMENDSNVTFNPNKTLRVTTIIERPYMAVKDDSDNVPENERYVGFCIELLKRMAADLGFTYSLHVVKDNKYGNAQENGTWNGMIGEILNDEADLAVAPLTVTYQRSQMVDFTKPFLSLGISVLFKIPQQQRPSLFSFMNPLGSATWLYILGASVVITFATYIIAHVTPYEWHFQHVCNNSSTMDGRDEKRPLINHFSFNNTCWYIFSTLLKGCCEFHPGTVSTRLMGGMWWVFALIIISAYTANLAAVLTVDRRYLPIKQLEDLANQEDILYGAVDGGSTLQFFKDSTNEQHKKMWKFISSKGIKVLAENNSDGVDRVLSSNYAFLMESTSLEYEVSQNCNLTQIGTVLGSKGYGIALTKGSKWTDPISRWILNYSETGQIEQLKMKWWHKRSSCSASSSATMKEERKSLNMDNVAGLFVILFVGLCLAVVTAVIEFCIKNRENAELDRQSLWSEMVQELCFALHMQKSTKRHQLHRRCSRCDTANSLTTHVPLSIQEVHEPLENGHFTDSPRRTKKENAMVRFDIG